MSDPRQTQAHEAGRRGPRWVRIATRVAVVAVLAAVTGWLIWRFVV